MRHLYITHPERGACQRCMRASFVDARSPQGGYLVYVSLVWPPPTVHGLADYSGFYHPNCRCEIELIGTEDRGNIDIINRSRVRKLSYPTSVSGMLKTRMTAKEAALAELLGDGDFEDLAQELVRMQVKQRPWEIHLGTVSSASTARSLANKTVRARAGYTGQRSSRPGDTPELGTRRTRRDSISQQSKPIEDARRHIEEMQRDAQSGVDNARVPPPPASGTPVNLGPTSAVRAFAESAAHQVLKIGRALARLIGR